LQALLEGAQAEKVEEVLRYMNAEVIDPLVCIAHAISRPTPVSQSVVPTASTLRTCAREFLKQVLTRYSAADVLYQTSMMPGTQGMVNASREAVELLREHYRVPDYLKERLRAIAASSEKVEHTHVYSSPASSEQHQHMTHRQ
jgi:hypothetical protein